MAHTDRDTHTPTPLARRLRSPVAWTRSLAGGGLSVAAAGLALGARVTGQVAELLLGHDRPDGRVAAEQPGAGADRDDRAVPPAPGENVAAAGSSTRAAPGSVVDPGSGLATAALLGAPLPDDVVGEHQRRAPSHVHELVGMAAPDVIAALERLSTDELRLVYEHEQNGRSRKTVLKAVERALAPATSTTVYSTGP